MKKLLLGLCGIAVFASIAFAGTEYSGKEMKQVAAPPPCPEWYADQEFNVGLWGTYTFTGTTWPDDRYFHADHAWGGGLDLKYFFHRYFGVGIEGWFADARRAQESDFVDFSDRIFEQSFTDKHHGIGSVLGTLTFRFPFHCSRWSPYVWAGGGGIFGGGGGEPINEFFLENEPGGPATGRPVTGPGGLRSNGGEGIDILKTVGHTNSESKAVGQLGAGIEYRITPHIGWISDFSWNIVDGTNNNFGMVRTGVNFAF